MWFVQMHVQPAFSCLPLYLIEKPWLSWLVMLCISECYVYSTDIDAEWLTACSDIQVGSSRIDFLYEGRDALEVKTPLSPFPLERIGNPYLLHVSSPAGPVLLVRHSL